MIHLRPHHLMCIQNFTGKGYDHEFIENMLSVIHKLEFGSGLKVKIIRGADDICSCCPNNNRGVCVYRDKVDKYDSLVLDVCGLKYQDIFEWDFIKNKVKKVILKPSNMKNICYRCEWLETCLSQNRAY